MPEIECESQGGRDREQETASEIWWGKMGPDKDLILVLRIPFYAYRSIYTYPSIYTYRSIYNTRVFFLGGYWALFFFVRNVESWCKSVCVRVFPMLKW